MVSKLIPVSRCDVDDARVLRVADLVLALDHRLRGRVQASGPLGLGKAAWIVFVIVLPYIGVLIYMIAQHEGMEQRNHVQVQQSTGRRLR